jgi:hypothetical protein
MASLTGSRAPASSKHPYVAQSASDLSAFACGVPEKCFAKVRIGDTLHSAQPAGLNMSKHLYTQGQCRPFTKYRLLGEQE